MNTIKKGAVEFAKTVVPGLRGAVVSYNLARKEATQSYHSVKNQAIKAIENIKNINDNPDVKHGFGIKTKDEWCQDIRFAQNMTSLIDQGRTLPPLDEGTKSDEYKKFKELIFDDTLNKTCGFKGGKFYKLKVKRNSKTKKQNMNSKKYKSKKLFRKSKKY